MTKHYCILGNCQANALASTLQVCQEFKDTYTFKKVTPIHRISPEEHADFLANTLPQVDLFVYQPISDGFRGGGFGFRTALENIGDKTVVLSYPSIQFYGYHASARTLKDLPTPVRDATRARFGLAGSELFHFSQLMMAFAAGYSQDTAAALFHDGFAEDDAFVRKQCARSLKQLEKSEHDFGVSMPLHGMIAQNYAKRQLFWSPRHPNGELLGDLALRILTAIGITPTADERARLSNRDPLRLPRYPLQRFVRDALSLEFDGLDAFASKTVSLDLPQMIAAYYDLYAMMGRDGVSAALDAAFPALQSWRALQDDLAA